jgi:Ferritin-like domain
MYGPKLPDRDVIAECSKEFSLRSGRKGSSHPRRRFLTRMLGVGAGAFGATMAGIPRTAHAGVVNDADILNFALNLEYLEAEYYTFAVTGMSIEALGIGTSGRGRPGPVTIKADPQVPFAIPAIADYANEVAKDEQAHVTDERSLLMALGHEPVARPAVDLLHSFNTLAQAAGLGASFDPFASDLNFLLGAYIFEDVGVSAYHGAAALIHNKNVLTAAAGILGIEAYHAGLIRTVLFNLHQGMTTQAISNVRLALGGATDYGVAAGPNGTSSIVLSDSSSIAISRTTRQVLNIVYGAVDAANGLFFPNGLNGHIS